MRYERFVLAMGLGASLCFGGGSEPHGRRPNSSPAAAAVVPANHLRVADTALLIRDPRVLDSRADLQFNEIVKLAFGDDGPGIVHDWLRAESARTDCAGRRGSPCPMEVLLGKWSSNPAGSAVLLAVANRLDAAELLPTGKVDGAEIRFIYTGAGADTEGDEYVRLILEVVLGPMEKHQFRQLARDTRSFADSDLAASAYLDWIKRMKRTVRIRVSTKSGNTWELEEFHFRERALQRVSLDRDLCGTVPIFDCLERGSAVGRQLAAMRADILASRFVLPAGLQAAKSVVGRTDGVVRLAGFGANQDDLRFSLSINSCRGCHGGEVQLKFHHLGFRKRGQTSSISHFLGGDNGSGDGPVVQQWTATLTTIACGTRRVIRGRQFNDLLRRHRFLYAIGESRRYREWPALFARHGLVATSR